MAGKRGNGEDSIYKSGGRWYVQGYIEEEGVKHRRKVSASTRTEAQKKWKLRKDEAAKGARRKGAPKNVAELLNDWLEMRKPDLKYKTLVGYQSAIDRHLIPHFGSMKLTAITAREVERWQSQLSGKQKLSRSTIHQARTVLAQAMDMAVRHGDLVSNPVRVAAPLKKRSNRVKAMSQDEARTLLRSVQSEDHQTRARLLIALSLGLRQGELLALKWEDIELEGDNPFLVVRAALQRQTGRGLVRVTPKTEKSHRKLYLPDEVVSVLRALSLQQKQLLLRSGGTFNPEGYVLVSSTGTPIDPANDRKQWLALLAAAELPEYPVHSSRHTAATLLLQEEDMHVVQQVLGHTSIRTTVDIYGHLSAADGAHGISRVASRLTA